VAIDDRLVMVVHVNEPDGGSHDVILTTTDGQTWLPSTLPGNDPWIDDLVATNKGLLAVGHDGAPPEWQARLWASDDGVTWTELEAPPDIALTAVVSAEDPLAVRSFDWLWIQGDDREWIKGTRLTNMSLLSGPGGFLAWDDRAGEDSRAFLMHSTDLLEWEDVDLSGARGPAEAVDQGDIAIHSTDEGWFFVPSRSVAPDTIFTSRDGLAWQEAPRPPGMDRPFWVAAVGDEIHAFERRVNGPSLLWTWRHGEAAGAPERAGLRQRIGLFPPIEWQGDGVTLNFRAPTEWSLELWRYEDDPIAG
jgi:hypothetical protein